MEWLFVLVFLPLFFFIWRINENRHIHSVKIPDGFEFRATRQEYLRIEREAAKAWEDACQCPEAETWEQHLEQRLTREMWETSELYKRGSLSRRRYDSVQIGDFTHVYEKKSPKYLIPGAGDAHTWPLQSVSMPTILPLPNDSMSYAEFIPRIPSRPPSETAISSAALAK